MDLRIAVVQMDCEVGDVATNLARGQSRLRGPHRPMRRGIEEGTRHVG